MLVVRLQSVRSQSFGSYQVLETIVKEEGFFGLWSGFGAGLSLTLNPGIMMRILARILPDSKVPVSALRMFWSVAFAKTIAGTVTYPLVRAKVQMQVQGMAKDSNERCRTTVGVLLSMLTVGGFQAMLDGLGLQLTNAVLKEAILLTLQKKIAALIAQMLLLLRRSRTRA